MGKNCYVPVKGLDDVLAEKVNKSWSPTITALYRGLYDEAHENAHLDTFDIDTAAEKLAEFSLELSKARAEAINSSGTNLGRNYRSLGRNFTSQQLYDRTNMISSIFSQVIDKIQAKNPGISRKALCKGFVSGGKHIAGEFAIFEAVRAYLLNYRDRLYNGEYYDQVNLIDQVLDTDNWGALVTLARVKLRDTESIKLGSKIEYAEDVNFDNFGNNEIAQLFDASESKREGWQEVTDLMSSFGSIGKQVRKALSIIPIINDEGNFEVDDLGFKRTMDPVTAHQTLQKLLRGVTSEEQMIRVLSEESQRLPWINNILQQLVSNNQLKTQFLVDLQKNFQPYSCMEEKIVNGVRKLNFWIRNKVERKGLKTYMTRVSLGKVENPSIAIYNNKGKVNSKNLEELIAYIDENFKDKSEILPSKFNERINGRRALSDEDSIGMLMHVMEALGIKTTKNTINSIFKNKDKRDLWKLLRAINDLNEYGLKPANNRNFELYKALIAYNPENTSTGSKRKGKVYEKISDIFEILDKNNSGVRLESRATFKDPKGNNVTFYSDVNPSYLGDFVMKIQNFVANKDAEGLRRFIEDKYFNCEYFIDNGEILNTWLEELYNTSFNSKDIIKGAADFVNNFTYDRFLGEESNSKSIAFENFTSKKHAISMIGRFFDKFTKDSKNFAYYPIFILGDSGVSKFIKARKYTTTEIIDGMYKVYRQEMRRKALVKATNESLDLKGYKRIENFSNTEDRFTMLQFLNKDHVSFDSSIGKYYEIAKSGNIDDVKKAIRIYMEDATKNFKSNMERLNVLEKDDFGRFKHFNDIRGDEEMDSALETYYWNTKFATIQQIQLMTIDPAFYVNTKDFQKRYKEIHAPGTKLSLEARDFNGKYYAGTRIDPITGLETYDNTERCVYFDDISVNGENIDQDFMKSILRNFAVRPSKEVEQAIKDGVTIVSIDDEVVEKVRINTLKGLLGKNFSIYEKYQKNTLTDGQGYRTLDSYRKVMGMAGKWTAEMQDAYDYIKSLKSQSWYSEDKPLPKEVLEKVTKLSVVFQPIKPYMFTHEKYQLNNDGQIALIPVQHKYAEAVLIPELLPVGSKLRGLANWMENHVDEQGNPSPIDLVGSTKIVKVGSFGSVDITNIKNPYNNNITVGEVEADYDSADSNGPGAMFGIKLNDKYIGTIAIDANYIGKNKYKSWNKEDGDTYISMSSVGDSVIIDDEERGKGYGKAAYIEFAKQVAKSGKILRSAPDFSRTEASTRVWKSLERDGYAKKVNNRYEIINSSLNVKKILSSTLDKAYVHQLDYADYRIQTNVPEHINSSQLFGTQVRKLIMSGVDLQNNTRYTKYVDGHKVNLGAPGMESVQLSGRNLISFYNSLIVSNILESFDSFKKDMSSKESVSNIFVQSTINNSRESMNNLLAYAIDDDGNFNIPLFEGALEHDSAALLFSIFKKRVNKQAIKGGSAVQVSAMGIAGYEEDGGLKYVTDPNNKNNILYAEAEIPWDLSYTDTSGHEIPLNYNDWCKEDGTLKVGKYINASDSRFSQYQSYKDDKGYYIPAIELKYPNILSMIAYRIPTERDYSMINIRIKRFSSKIAGGTIKVPAQGTTIAGFDFDIDKLYFMRYEFSQKEFSKDQISEIWSKIYEENPDIKEALLKARIDTYKDIEFMDSFYKVFHHSFEEENAEDLIDKSKDRLYKYWKDAGLEGTPEEAFNNFVNKHPEYTSLDTYDFGKPPLSTYTKRDKNGNIIEENAKGNSRVARNNMLIHLIQQRLMDSETFKQRYTPGGFSNSSRAARSMRELEFGKLDGLVDNGRVNFDELHKRFDDKSISDPEPNYDPSDPMTMIIYNQQNQVAGKLIGIFANQNTNHAFASLMNVFRVKRGEEIEFAGHSYERDGIGKDFLHAPDGVDVDLNVAEFLAASVDAVKDPVLNFLNLNTVTADAGAVLARLGYTTEEIGLLFNQPIIKELCEHRFNNDSSSQSTIIQIVKKYLPEGEIPNSVPIDDFSSNRLALNIINNRIAIQEGRNMMDNEEFRMNQLKVLDLFKRIQNIAGDVSQFVTSSKFTASNAVGSTFGDLYAQQMKVASYLNRFVKKNGKDDLHVEMEVSNTVNTPINDSYDNLNFSNEKYLASIVNNPFAYEQAMFDMNRKANLILNKYYPYNTDLYVRVRERLSQLSSYGNLDADTINSIHRDILVYLLSQRSDSIFNGEAPAAVLDSNGNRVFSEDLTNREYYNNKFGKYLFKYLEDHPELKKLSIFEYMTFNVDDQENVSIELNGVGGINSTAKDTLKESWAELININSDLALDLFMYNYYKIGFNFSPIGFMHLAPIELKEAIMVGYKYENSEWKKVSYKEFLNNVLENKYDFDIDKFAKEYILNHTENKRFVYSVYGKTLDQIKSKVYTNDVMNKEFYVSLSTLGDYSKEFLINDPSLKEKELAFKPFISIEGRLFMCVTNGPRFNVTTTGEVKYVRIEKMGTTNSYTKYTNEDAFSHIKIDKEHPTNYVYKVTEGTTSPSETTEDIASSEIPIRNFEDKNQSKTEMSTVEEKPKSTIERLGIDAYFNQYPKFMIEGNILVSLKLLGIISVDQYAETRRSLWKDSKGNKVSETEVRNWAKKLFQETIDKGLRDKTGQTICK